MTPTFRVAGPARPRAPGPFDLPHQHGPGGLEFGNVRNHREHDTQFPTLRGGEQGTELHPEQRFLIQ